MFIGARATRVMCSVAIALSGACSERSPRAGQEAQPGSGAPAVDERPPRFSSDELELAMVTMKACAERDNSPRAMFECACRSDLALSREPAPPDPAAHCAAYADRAVALAQRTEDEQKRSPLQLAASDVAPGSFILFSIAAPCLINAVKSKKKEQALTCLCVVHALANRMARRNELKTQSDYMVALGVEANAVKASGPCGLKDGP